MDSNLKRPKILQLYVSPVYNKRGKENFGLFVTYIHTFTLQFLTQTMHFIPLDLDKL